MAEERYLTILEKVRIDRFMDDLDIMATRKARADYIEKEFNVFEEVDYLYKDKKNREATLKQLRQLLPYARPPTAKRIRQIIYILENWWLTRRPDASPRLIDIVGINAPEVSPQREAGHPRPTRNNTRRQRRLFEPKTLNIFSKIRKTTARNNSGKLEEIWPIDINELNVEVGNTNMTRSRNVGWAAKTKKRGSRRHL
jgi:hypothetical protein